MQKCLDKDPAKRWTCERLMNHQLFEEYIARRKEATVEQTDDSNRPREKSKVKLNKKKKSRMNFASNICLLLTVIEHVVADVGERTRNQRE